MNQNIGGSVRVDCSAKLNLFLEVLGKRDDGFHEVETLLAAVSWYDSLYFTNDTTGALRLQCHWANGLAARQQSSRGDLVGCLGRLPEPADNLVWRALRRLREVAGIEAGASIQLIKRIPAMAGLGGASSDTAAALLAANRGWQLNWPLERLSRLAAELGSDVPFFLTPRSCGSAMAVARGRGERIETLQGTPRLHVVIVKPPAGLSTPRVFAECRPAGQPVNLNRLLDGLRSAALTRIGDCLFNRLQTAASEITPWIARVRNAFQQLDCLGHCMSGSGSSYFGLFRNARQAARQAARLRSERLGYVVVTQTTTAPCQMTGIDRLRGSAA